MKNTDKSQPKQAQGQRKPKVQPRGKKQSLEKRQPPAMMMQASEEKFRRLFETAQDGILLLDAETGVISEANPFIEELLGYSRDELIGRKLWEIGPFKDITASQDAFLVLQKKHYIRYEDLPLETKDGRRRNVEFVSNVYRVGSQKVIQCNIRDITERRQVERALAESERRYRELFDNAGLGVFQSAADGRVIAVNPEFARMFGYKSPEEFIALVKNAVDVFADPQRRVEIIRLKAETPDLTRFESLYRRKDGSTFLGNLTVRQVTGPDGHELFFEGLVEDITERKRMEEALRLRMEQLVALNQASQTVAISLDLNQVLTEIMSLAGKVVGSEYTSVVLVDEAGHISRSVENMSGVLSIGRRARKRGFTSWILRARRPAVVDEIGESGVIRPRVGEGAPRTANPHLVAKGIKSFVGLPLIVEERTVGVLYLHSLHPGTFHDQLTLLTTFASQAAIAIEKARLYDAVQQELAELKQAEQALQESEERFREIFENMSSGAVVYEAVNGGDDFKINNFNRAAEKIEKISRETVIGKTICEAFPGVKEFGLFEVFQRVWETGKPEHFPVGLYKDERVSGWRENYVARLPSGEVVAVYDDVTERKRAEEALRESEAQFRGLAEQAITGITVIQENKWVYVNPRLAEMLGYTQDDMIGMKPVELVVEADRELVQESFRKRLSGEAPIAHYTFRARCKDGTEIELEVHGSTLTYRGRPAILSTLLDITERKRAEEALARQTEELRQRNEELSRLYRASGSLLSGASLSLQELAQTIVGVVQKEFGQANCSLLLIHRDSNELQRLAAAGPYTDQVKYNNLTLDGPGLVPRAIHTSEVVNVGDVRSTTDYVQGWDLAQSELAIPLKVGSDVIGAIDVQSSEPDAFSPDDERLMTIFAERAALALEHSRLNAQTESRMQQLIALRTVDMAISGSFDINLTLGVLLDQVTGQLGVHAADILIFNAAAQTFEFSCERGFRTQTLRHTRLKFGAGYAWRLVRERQVINIPDIKKGPDGLQRSPDLSGEQFVAYVGIPLIAKGQIKGVLEIFHREPVKFEPEWYRFLELLAGQAAIAIDNAELFDNLQSSNSELSMAYDSTLEGWASALELRDNETEGHTRRATELTTRLAQAMGIKENDMVHIYRGALLHDIGKMGVPDSIVLKPSPLTEDEWVTMRKHSQYAYDMLSPISYLRLALDIPYCHHEKWDGTGYPRGLKGEQIPLAARIFAVVDVWDALTSDRPYRNAWPAEKAIDFIHEQAGKHFDPKVVEIFLREVKHA